MRDAGFQMKDLIHLQLFKVIWPFSFKKFLTINTLAKFIAGVYTLPIYILSTFQIDAQFLISYCCVEAVLTSLYIIYGAALQMHKPQNILLCATSKVVNNVPDSILQHMMASLLCTTSGSNMAHGQSQPMMMGHQPHGASCEHLGGSDPSCRAHHSCCQTRCFSAAPEPRTLTSLISPPHYPNTYPLLKSRVFGHPGF